MKKITLLVSFLVVALFANAQILLDETFNYPGTSIANSWTSLVNEPTWTNLLASNYGTIGTIGNLSADALSYGDANGFYALSGTGKLVTSDYTGASGATESKVVKAITPTSSGVIYMSLLFKPGVAQNQSNSEIMGLSIAGGNGPKVLICKGTLTTTNFRFATTRASSSSTDYKFGLTEFSDINQTFLLVVKYDWTAKTASLFVNPVIGSTTEPTPEVIDNSSTKDVTAAIDGIRFRCTGSSASKFQVSGVRVSTSWAAAVGKQVAELVPPTASAATSLTNNGCSANWTPVANATGYDVGVYAAGVLVKTVSVTGPTVATAAITGLYSNTAYTYKVTAVADKLTFANSQPGADSPTFTTLGLSVPEVGAATNITTTGFTANWTSVVDATGYDVQLLLNTTLVGTFTALGNGTNSLALNALQMGTTYSYKVIAKGTIESTPSALITCNTLAASVNSINTDFSQAAVWGNCVQPPSTNLPSNGNYPTWKANGFSFEKALIYGGSNTGVNGETHTNLISFDKLTTAAVVFPAVNSVAQIEFHAYSGSDAKVIALDELGADGTTWNTLFTYPTNKLEATYIENVSRSTPTTFRLRNNGTTSMNVTQIIVRPTLPTTTPLATPAAPNAATNLIAGGFTASWTPVANATGYIVSVWNAAKPVGSNFTVKGTGTTYNVIGLDSASVCTYKVAAIGDGITNSNSLLSPPSASFSITAGLVAVDQAKVSTSIWSNGKSIYTAEVGDMDVYNLQGMKMISAKRTNQITTNLKSGLYLVKFTNQDRKTTTTKIVIY
ncbi:MAG: T9SS type A sorting domain-containing protein [Bacteroidia bacterium]|nr:T9SS type A sorting domain-containing protein [Bacteroidia bacterium]